MHPSLVFAQCASPEATPLAFSPSDDDGRRPPAAPGAGGSGSSAWHVRDLRRNRDFRLGIFERDRHPRSLDAPGKTSGVEFAQRLSQLGLSY
jgi:hypothetical protein